MCVCVYVFGNLCVIMTERERKVEKGKGRVIISVIRRREVEEEELES